MRTFLMIYLFFNVGLVHAQKITEKCIVDERGNAIPFVDILLSSGKGLISDVNGRYILNTEINKDSIVVFSHIAYHPLELKAKLIPDTLKMSIKEHELSEVQITKLNIHKLLTQTFSRKKYVSNGNYLSTRLIGIEDSLVYFTEEQQKLTKINVKKRRIKRKGYGKISYNVDSIDSYKINFPIISTFLQNPHEFYKIKKNLTELISTSKLVKQYPDYYQLESVKDGVKITMYIDKNSSRLIRFEKITMQADKGSNNMAYCYNFKLSGKNIIIESFKYKTVLKASNSNEPTYDVYLFDILLDDVTKIKSKKFNSLNSLRLFKQQSQVIDKDFLRYFKNKKEAENTKNVNVSLLKKYGSIKLPVSNLSKRVSKKPKQPLFYLYPSYPRNFNSQELNFDFLDTLFKPYYMAGFNKATKRRNFYPSDSKINFDIHSPQVTNQYFNPLKKDSFNPYGVNSPQESIVIGTVNFFIQLLQK